jgi:CHAT domain-containing protein
MRDIRQLILAFIAVSLLLEISFGTLATTITVPDDYLSIQAAIDAAYPEGTVYIRAGVYKENLVIDKPLSLIGEDRTTTVIRSLDPEEDVIAIILSQGCVDITRIGVSGGYRGVYVVTDTNAHVMLNGIIASRNLSGVSSYGDGTLNVIASYFVDNDSIGLLLANAKTRLISNEILRGETGVLLVGAVDATLDNNLIGLCQWGIETYTKGCGYSQGYESFVGRASGKGNRVYSLSIDVCPEYHDPLWPSDHLDVVWRNSFSLIVASYNTGVRTNRSLHYQEACAAYLECLSIFARENITFPLFEAYVLQNLGVVYWSLGLYEEALPAYESALSIYIDRRLEVDAAEVNRNFGDVYWALGRFSEALAAYRFAHAVYVDREMMLSVAEINNGIGLVLDSLSRYDEALAKYEEARAVLLKQGTDFDVATVDLNIGVTLASLGRFGEALTKYEGVRAVFVEQGTDVNVATVDQYIGNVHFALGNYQEALAKYTEVRPIYGTQGTDFDVSSIEQNIGLVYLSLGQYEEALARFREARLILVEQEGMDAFVAAVDLSIGTVYHALGRYKDAIASYEMGLALLDNTPAAAGMDYSHPATRWMIRNNMGLALEGLEESDEAIEAYEEAIAVIESIRSGFTSEDIKQAWQEKSQHVYERLIDLLYRMNQGSGAFTYAERCRARTFLDLLAEGPVETLKNVADEGIRTGVVEASVIEADLAEIVADLPANTAALEYFVTDDTTYVWVIHGGEVQGPVPLPHGRGALMDQVIACRQAIEEGNPAADLYLAILYDWLIAPVKDLLPLSSGGDVVPHLVIVPSGPLYYLPFQALLHVSKDRKERQRLIERYTLSYTPSLVTLKYAQQQTTPLDEVSFLALADPDSGDPTMVRLPEGQTESRRIASLFSVSEVYVDAAATESVVQSRASVVTDVLFSTHGKFNAINPMYSYLLLSPAEDSDGRLYTYEVFGLPLSANLVVLSACETLLPSMADMEGQIRAVRATPEDEEIELTSEQLETLTMGDEISGLTRAFLYAGTSSVLSSLWSVYSQATADLMVAIYEGIQAGKDKAAAHRDAQLQIMHTPGYEHPAYWAAFNLMGDWK